MRPWFIAILLSAATLAQDKPPEAPASDEARVRWLIQELGSDSFERREKATNELMQMGKQALREVDEALQKAKDPEVRKSIESLQQFLGAAERVTLERLQTLRVSFTFEEGGLGHPMKDLMLKTKIPIELILDDPNSVAIPAASFKESTLEEILNWVAKSTELQWRMRGERKVVFFRAEGADVPGVVLELYDVRALTSAVTDYALPMARGADDGGDEPSEAIPVLGGDDLVQLIRDSVAKPSWDEEGRSINFQSGMLIVKCTAEVHGQIVKFLKKFRQERIIQLRTEVLAVAHTPTFMADELSRQPRVLTDAQLESIRSAAAEGKDAVLIGGLEMVGYQNQRVAAAHGVERMIVTGYDNDGHPRLEPLYDGLGIMVRPTLSENRQSVNINVQGSLAKTLSIEKVKTDAGEIQIPKQYRTPVRISPSVESGKPVVLVQTGSLEGFGQGKTQLLIVVRVTPQAEK